MFICLLTSVEFPLKAFDEEVILNGYVIITKGELTNQGRKENNQKLVCC
jgi:hypothetical protein